MDGGILASVISGAAIIGGAIGWLFRQYWYRREVRRQAAHDVGEILKERKVLIEDMISKTKADNDKQTLLSELAGVNDALRGFYVRRLRHTLEEAGYPPEEILIADGRRQLQPKQVTDIMGLIEVVKTLPPFLSNEDLWVLGSAYYYMERYQDAKAICDRILNLNPDDPAILNNRGVTYAELSEYDKALADFNHSLELRPDDPGTLSNRGGIYAKLERYEEALADFNRSLEFKPDEPTILYNRASTYGDIGRYNEALADYNRSIELRPDDPSTLNNRGTDYFKLEKYDEALADYNRSLELRPDHPDTLTNRGLAYAKLERYDEALADFNRSLELRPDDPDTIYDLACVFSLWGKPEDSIAYLKRAIELDRKSREKAKTDKDFDNIREDPRFKKLLESD